MGEFEDKGGNQVLVFAKNPNGDVVAVKVDNIHDVLQTIQVRHSKIH